MFGTTRYLHMTLQQQYVQYHLVKYFQVGVESAKCNVALTAFSGTKSSDNFCE